MCFEIVPIVAFRSQLSVKRAQPVTLAKDDGFGSNLIHFYSSWYSLSSTHQPCSQYKADSSFSSPAAFCMQMMQKYTRISSFRRCLKFPDLCCASILATSSLGPIGKSMSHETPPYSLGGIVFLAPNTHQVTCSPFASFRVTMAQMFEQRPGVTLGAAILP